MSNIYLSRIGIQDFRTFGKFEIDVPPTPGLVLVTGTNGLGKSSFFDAIEWGLTGTIRRFAPYLQTGRKKLLERDYLTRRGAEPGSHKVMLTFSEGEPIERSGDKAPPMASVIAKLARPDRRAIDDLSTYLALTHFLGQAAQQRFTSRKPEEQWQALKGPSGIERLERVRAGLRGRSTLAAFTRRLDLEQAAVATLDRDIAAWEGWTARLDRLRQAARATGHLTSAELTERVDALDAELAALRGAPVAISGESVSLRLTGLGERIGEAVRDTQAYLATLDAMEEVPAAFTAVSADARIDHPVLLRTRQALSDAREAVEAAGPAVEAATSAVTAQAAAIAMIDQNIVLLDGARTDLARRTQLAEQIATARQDGNDIADVLSGYRETIARADAICQEHGDAVTEVARLRSVAQSARGLIDAYAGLRELEATATRAAETHRTAAEAAATAQLELTPLTAAMTDLARQIVAAEQARAEADRHASAISGALAQLASHIHDDETECPVCQSVFEPGALKALAEVAAASSDSRLASADDKLEQLREKESETAARVAALRAIVDAAIEPCRQAASADEAVTGARAALAHALEATTEDDLAALASARDLHAAQALAAAELALEPLAADAAAAAEQRMTISAEREELILRESQLTARLDTFTAEDKACAERIAARGLADASLEALDKRLSDQRAQLEAARAQSGRLHDAATAAAASHAAIRGVLDEAEREHLAAEAARASAEATVREMTARWTRAGLEGTPNQPGLDRRKVQASDALIALRSLGERVETLGRDNEDALLQGEVVEVLAAMRQAGGEAATADPAAYLSGLKTRAAAARAAAKLTMSARTAVKRYTEELKVQSDDFSNRVLDPLNVVIDDFNEAMLSTPGETIQFKADTRIDATSFGMALRYREKLEHAIETPKDLPPQVVLSEGQLAANGFSILCAASTAYPWSRWRALLLDDPLQHNDIIHTAAFVDVMRNMVELNGYQLIMSSHDRGESDFIARKFDAAGLPCSTILLTAPSEKGVVWDRPQQNQAATRALLKAGDELRLDSA